MKDEYLSGFVYPVSVHWVVNDGWLHHLGFDDFAYGAVVHALGGAAALAAAIVVGPRIGRYDEDGNHVRIFLHSLPVVFTACYWLNSTNNLLCQLLF